MKRFPSLLYIGSLSLLLIFFIGLTLFVNKRNLNSNEKTRLDLLFQQMKIEKMMEEKSNIFALQDLYVGKITLLDLDNNKTELHLIENDWDKTLVILVSERNCYECVQKTLITVSEVIPNEYKVIIIADLSNIRELIAFVKNNNLKFEAYLFSKDNTLNFRFSESVLFKLSNQYNIRKALFASNDQDELKRFLQNMF